jgi:dethiobiotin synthetase
VIVAVVGNGTEVGKTWTACILAKELINLGVSVVARKPTQSSGDSGPSDAERLGRATGEPPESVCSPRWSYSLPMAPPMAAEALDMSELLIRDIHEWTIASIEEATPALALVELVGGVCSPQASDGDGLDLLQLLQPAAVLLVSDAGLGALNATRLSMRALRGDDCLPLIQPTVVFNRYDASVDLHVRNLRWLRDRDQFDVVEGTRAALAQLAARLAQSSTARPRDARPPRSKTSGEPRSGRI